MTKTSSDSILSQRRAGVLLHPSSLPGKQAKGTIGQQAKNFLHFIKDCGLSVWQMLPLGPTHGDGSPYQCLSVHAGNPELIDLDWLVDHDWLKPDEIDIYNIQNSLTTAANRFFHQANGQWLIRFNDFVDRSNYWLSDYSLFMSLKQTYNNSSWIDWPLCYRFRQSDALNEARNEHAELIKSIQFIQFVFFTQWHELKDDAAQLGILLFGDMPIYVALDSCDVWAEKDNFLMQEDGRCKYVAGVPPDAFSDEGQLWGNPLYDWDYLKKNDFGWWVDRFKTQLELFDIIRVDHFRGLEACWQIPGNADTAVDGEWVKTPGKELLHSLNMHFDNLPLVAEDLGFITPEVENLRDQFNLPGMLVLQFAFEGKPTNPYLPHNHQSSAVVYTGTHDNDTTLGWYRQLDETAKNQLLEYIGGNKQAHLNIPWDIIRLALSSVANLAVIPLQDLLSLGTEHRMNMPGTTEGNWSWRFDWSQVWQGLPTDLRNLNALYGRRVDSPDKVDN